MIYMTENNDMMPQLTLSPEGMDPALTETAAAVAEATMKTPEAPNLTLNPTVTATPEDAALLQKTRDENAVKLDESQLTEAERKMVNEFSEKIDITDSNVVLQYGASAQKNIAGFSENTLNSVKTKDLGEIGDALSGLVVELKGFSVPEKKGIAGFFQKKRNEMEEMKAGYAKAEVNVGKISSVLEGHQVSLMKDIAMLDQMYDLNTKYYKELTMYIIAGKKKLAKVRENDLEALRKQAAASGSQEDAQ
ncbi:MAG: toxic anion resistance protein, partial [Pseudoflavonifractor sp.]